MEEPEIKELVCSGQIYMGADGVPTVSHFTNGKRNKQMVGDTGYSKTLDAYKRPIKRYKAAVERWD